MVYNTEASNTIICFHGFGQEATAYEWLAKAEPQLKVISIDLFFHGKSVLATGSPLTPPNWKAYFNFLIEQENLTQFSLAGYSLGGRFALTTFRLYPQRVKAIYLSAADGIVASRLYKIATGTAVMRSVFKGMLNSYPAFIKISNALTRLGILNKGLQKFALLHMKEASERVRIYNSWTAFRLMKLSPKRIAQISVKHQIPVHIALGKFDRVIPVDRIKPHLIQNQFLDYKTVDITHGKLFYYNFWLSSN